MAVAENQPEPITSDESGVGMALDKILVVDDMPTNRKLMELMFSNSEFNVVLASNGEEALAKAHAELPFLVLSDIQMPKMDGFSLCERLKADDTTKNMAVIFVTAHQHTSASVSKGLDLGADDYIFRPFQRDELLARVRAVARLKRAETEARHQAQMAERRNRELEVLNTLALAAGSAPGVVGMFDPALQQLAHLLDAGAVALLLSYDLTPRLTVSLAAPEGESVRLQLDTDFQPGVTPLEFQDRVPTLLRKLLDGMSPPLFGLVPDEDLSIRAIPIAGRDVTFGALAVVNKSSRVLTTADWKVINSVAGIVTVAMENARLWRSVQQQVEDQTLLNRVGQAVTSTLNLDQILKITTTLIRTSLDAHAASVWLMDEGTQELVLTCAAGRGDQTIVGFRMPIHQGIAGNVARTGTPYLATDLSSDPLYYQDVTASIQYAPGAILCVPLRSQDRVIGVLQALHNQVHGFQERDLQLFQLVASSVSVAVQNAQLFAEVETFNEQLERTVAERTQALQEERGKIAAILAGMADGLLVLDADNRIMTANVVAETMLNFNLGEMQGQVIRADLAQSPLWRCVLDIASGAELSPESAVDVPDPKQPDRVISIQARASKILDGADLVGTAIVLRDITALKDVERMKARFMAGVTHELKTPLSIIKMHVKNIQTYHRRLPAAKRKVLLASTLKQVTLLEELVESILELSRLDSGSLALSFEKCELAPLITQVVEELRPLAEAKRLSLKWRAPANAIAVVGDTAQLERVVRNLLDNALKYTPEKGSVTVDLSLARKFAPGGPAVSDDLREESENICALIRVTDSGIGISSEAQTRIFERFYRVDPSHTVPGSGLGLSIVKEIVQIHGGTIAVESAPGAGSTFLVRLPRFVQSSAKVD